MYNIRNEVCIKITNSDIRSQIRYSLLQGNAFKTLRENDSSRLLYIGKIKVCNRIFMTRTLSPEANRILTAHFE